MKITQEQIDGCLSEIALTGKELIETTNLPMPYDWELKIRDKYGIPHDMALRGSFCCPYCKKDLRKLFHNEET